ncbi:unnamed protein product [Soboliphyme baturini]|uniref:DUF4789 domain-containing protein n=1 Tax=Soboliphyme baturini TaxID=241478 RepID=A0A183IM27_9BILA|nr:unnamed protein product [Soboliphyme baturini]
MLYGTGYFLDSKYASYGEAFREVRNSCELQQSYNSYTCNNNGKVPMLKYWRSEKRPGSHTVMTSENKLRIYGGEDERVWRYRSNKLNEQPQVFARECPSICTPALPNADNQSNAVPIYTMPKFICTNSDFAYNIADHELYISDPKGTEIRNSCQDMKLSISNRCESKASDHQTSWSNVQVRMRNHEY